MILWALLWCCLDFISWNIFRTVFFRLMLLDLIYEAWHSGKPISPSMIFIAFLACMELTVMSGMAASSLFMLAVLIYLIYVVRAQLDVQHRGFIVAIAVTALLFDQIAIKKGAFLSLAGVYSTFVLILVNLVAMYIMIGIRGNRSLVLVDKGRKVWTPSRKGA